MGGEGTDTDTRPEGDEWPGWSRVVSVGPPLGVDPAGKMRLRIPNKQTKKNYLQSNVSDLYEYCPKWVG